MNDALFEVSSAPVDGRFSAVAALLSEDAVLNLFDSTARRGQGYLEISHPGLDWPMLAVSVSGAIAVVHLFASAESLSLLAASDGTAGMGVVEVLVMDQLASFDLSYAVKTGVVRGVLEQFLRGGSMDAFVWHRL